MICSIWYGYMIYIYMYGVINIMYAFFISFNRPCITSLFTHGIFLDLMNTFSSKFSTFTFLKSKTKQLQSRSMQSLSGIMHAASWCIPSQWWQHLGGTKNVKAHIELNKNIFGLRTCQRNQHAVEQINHPIGFCSTSNCKRYTPYNFDMLPSFSFTCIVLSTTLLCISSASHVNLVWICPSQKPPRIQSRKKVIPKIWPVITVIPKNSKETNCMGKPKYHFKHIFTNNCFTPKIFLFICLFPNIVPISSKSCPPPYFCSPSLSTLQSSGLPTVFQRQNKTCHLFVGEIHQVLSFPKSYKRKQRFAYLS